MGAGPHVVKPELAWVLSNLLSARSLLSKGASKMLRATGHARMVSLGTLGNRL